MNSWEHPNLVSQPLFVTLSFMSVHIGITVQLTVFLVSTLLFKFALPSKMSFEVVDEGFPFRLVYFRRRVSNDAGFLKKRFVLRAVGTNFATAGI